jgi:hypothetical protein
VGWALFAATAAKGLAFGGPADQIAMMWIYGAAGAGLVAGLAAGAVLFGLAAILEAIEATRVPHGTSSESRAAPAFNARS